jgi:hypothetical protein
MAGGGRRRIESVVPRGRSHRRGGFNRPLVLGRRRMSDRGSGDRDPTRAWLIMRGG